MGTPAEFRKNAAQCIELAQTATRARDRSMLLDLAMKWLQLAGVTQHEMDLIRQHQDD
jgi:hypothetical protein